MFHKAQVFVYLFSLLHFHRVIRWNGKIHKMISYFSFLVNQSCLLTGAGYLKFCISKSHRVLCILFFRTDSGLRIHHLVVWLKFLSLAQFPVDHLSHSAEPSLALLLHLLAAFTNVINHFISVSQSLNLLFCYKLLLLLLLLFYPFESFSPSYC